MKYNLISYDKIKDARHKDNMRKAGWVKPKFKPEVNPYENEHSVASENTEGNWLEKLIKGKQ